MDNSETTDLKVRPKDLPALFRAADRASVTGQQRYVSFVIANLSLLVLGALATSISVVSLQSLLAACGAALLIIGVALTMFTWVKPFHKEWYGGRAIAESVKTLAWRYVMRAEPYDGEKQPEEVRRLFEKHLRDILQNRQWLGAALVNLDGSADQITGRMQDLREQSLEQRKAIYLRDRVEDQQQWYAKKAAGNNSAAMWWFAGLIVCQVGAAGTAILLAVCAQLKVNLAAIFAAGAAAIVAWIQVKQYEELAQAYGLTANELSFLRSRSDSITSDEQLSEFVIDVENAISKEHTLWVARRGAT